MIWLVVSTYPSEKWWTSSVGIINDIPNWMESHKIPWFQSPPISDISTIKTSNYFTSCDPHHGIYTFCYFKMYKTPQLRTTFGSWDVEKVYAVVARSTFPSENVQNNQNTPFSDHFWKLRCRRSARRCGAKHISKSKCTKHTRSGPLLEVAMSNKCTPLWREAHFQVKMYKTHQVRTTFGSCDVEKVHAVVARNTFPSQKC